MKKLHHWRWRAKRRKRKTKYGLQKTSKKKEKIRLIFWNVAGIRNKDKRFWEYIKEFDVVGLTETWVEEKDWEKIEENLPKVFKWSCTFAKRIHKKGRARGGILTGVRKEIKEIEVKDKYTDDIQERKIKINEKSWRILTVYNNNRTADILKEIEEAIEEADESNLILAGDLNARIGEEGSITIRDEDDKRSSKDKTINKEGLILLETIRERGWLILNGNIDGDEEGEFTYIGPRGESVIDYGIVNSEAFAEIDEMKIGSRIESDHQPIIIQLNNSTEREVQIDERRRTTRTIWTAEGIQEYRFKVQETIIKTSNLEEELNQLVGEIQKAVKKKEISECRNEGNNKWWGRECKIKKREANKALRHFQAGRITREQYLSKRKEYKNTCERRKVEEAEAEEQEIKNLKSENEVWKYIRKEKKIRKKASSNIKITEWEKYFMELLNGQKEFSRDEQELEMEEEEEDENITEEEVKYHIKNLKKNKSAGEDKVQNEAWIYATENIIQKITQILNRVWKGEGLPDRWRKGVVRPIHKKGSTEETKNYRGITLMDTAYKIYASILNQRLQEEIEEKKLLPDTQAGFRKGRGTMDNIYILKHTVDKEINEKGGKVYVFFADLKAAFDNVNREILIETLRNTKISPRLVKRIREIYIETRVEIEVNGNKTEEFWTTKGVKQGCPLSPTLFSMYIADLEKHMEAGQTGRGKKKVLGIGVRGRSCDGSKK